MALQTSFIVSLLALATLHGMDAIDYVVVNLAEGTRGGILFDKELGVEYTRKQMETATEFIWDIFQQNDPRCDKRNSIQRISLYIVDDLPLPVSSATCKNEIHVSDKHIEASFGDELKQEFNGLLYHEMTRAWQWDGNGQRDRTLGGLLSGIAAFVRMEANYTRDGWAEPGEGDKWYEGYDVTARFLEYCENAWPQFIAELNKKMKDGYNTTFFYELLGKNVDDLWSEYKNQTWS